VSTDPVIVSVETMYPSDGSPAQQDRLYYVRDNIERAGKWLEEKLPRHYANAVATDASVRTWVHDLVVSSLESSMRAMPIVGTGPSLLLLGPTGTGKTYQAYGAMRALSLSGLLVSWQFATAADIYARLRPRHKVDSEEEFTSLANARVLVIDDLGAAKSSEWTEEINYRLINHRYERELPTLITSNVSVAQLKDAMGDRVTSRLVEMTTRVVLRGEDRRRSKAATTSGEAA
jgi:DNA replication protein DnaC